jgi:hypothetical protein
VPGSWVSCVVLKEDGRVGDNYVSLFAYLFFERVTQRSYEEQWFVLGYPT